VTSLPDPCGNLVTVSVELALDWAPGHPTPGALSYSFAIVAAFGEQGVDYRRWDAPETTEFDAGDFAAGDQVLDVLTGAAESGCELGRGVTEALDFGPYGRREVGHGDATFLSRSGRSEQ
jgi:hypothetical protein